MHGEKLIVEIGTDQPAFRARKLKSHGHRGEPCEEQESESRDDVAPADDLVIDGRERADEAFRRAPCFCKPRRQLRTVDLVIPQLFRIRRRICFAHFRPSR